MCGKWNEKHVHFNEWMCLSKLHVLNCWDTVKSCVAFWIFCFLRVLNLMVRVAREVSKGKPAYTMQEWFTLRMYVFMVHEERAIS